MIGIVRLRQFADRARHSLSFVPTWYVLGSIVLAQLLLWIDSGLTDASLPAIVETTVDGARSVFGAIAGGLITSTTLLLSMMLVAVQLASSQFSPRTLRNWLGNRTVQNAIGLVLGTTVFCLLALRATRDLGENDTAIVPHITVMVAVGLGVLSLIAVVRTVDHITKSLQVSSVAERVASETIAVIERLHRTETATERVGVDSGALRADGSIDIPVGAHPIEAPIAGWVQQVDDDAMLSALPDRSSGYVTATPGSFVMASSPVIWVAPTPDDLEACRSAVLDSVAIGGSRTMQHDVEFGITQLTDIAVRALSPGVNDPSTACDVVVQLGDVMTSLWEYPPLATTVRAGTRTLVQHRPTHAQLLDRAVAPILHYGGSDREVTNTLSSVLQLLRSEVQRRELPGPIEPLDATLAQIDERRG